MTQFSVGDDGGLHHPVHADPCTELPAGPLFTRPPRQDDNSGRGSGSGSSGSGSGGSDDRSSQLTPQAPQSTRFTAPSKRSKRCRTVKRKVKVRGKTKTKKVVSCTPKAKAKAKKGKRKAAPKRKRPARRS